jgi:hypothetical protein
MFGMIYESYPHHRGTGAPLELQDIGRFGIGTSIREDDPSAYLIDVVGASQCHRTSAFGFYSFLSVWFRVFVCS